MNRHISSKVKHVGRNASIHVLHKCWGSSCTRKLTFWEEHRSTHLLLLNSSIHVAIAPGKYHIHCSMLFGGIDVVLQH